MDEYVGGIATNYMTNANMLKRGLETISMARGRFGKSWS